MVLTVVLLQLFLCANGIEGNPGPDPDMEMNASARTVHTARSRLKFQIVFGQQVETIFQTLDNGQCL